jgi:hypothetical protein
MSALNLVQALATPVIALTAVIATVYGADRNAKSMAALQSERLLADQREKQTQILREKSEEVFELVSQFQDDFKHNLCEVAKKLMGNEASKAFEGVSLNSSMMALSRVELLARVYVPHAVAAIEKLKAEVDKRGQLFLAVNATKNPTELMKIGVKMTLLTTGTAEYTEEVKVAVIESLHMLQNQSN